MRVLLPSDWDYDRDEAMFDEGCLVPGAVEPSACERYSPHGVRKLIWPTTKQLSADDWSRAALRQLKFGCDRVVIYEDYCRNALKLDPNNIAANLLLGERPHGGDAEGARPYLETVVRHANPGSLEYAHAKKMLSGQAWTYVELCDRMGADGVLH